MKPNALNGNVESSCFYKDNAQSISFESAIYFKTLSDYVNHTLCKPKQFQIIIAPRF